MMSNNDLKAYLDQELSGEEKLNVERMVGANPALAAELEELKALSGALKQVVVPQPVGLEQTLFALSRAPKTPWYVRKPGWAYGLAAACIAGIAFLSVPVTKQDRAEFETASYATKEVGTGGQMAIEGQISRSAPADMPVAAPAEMSDQVRGRSMAKLKAEAPTQGGVFIERNGSLAIRVPEIEPAVTQAKSIAKQLGGFVADSSVSTMKDMASANLTLRVPENKFEAAIERAKELGEITNESTSSEDITTQTVDTEARLKALKQEEEQYLVVMKQARSVKDILQVQQQLSRVRGEIESMTATLKSLKDRAGMSTLSLLLEQRPTGGREALKGNWAVDAKNGALTSAKVKLQKIGSMLIYAGVYSVVWIPLLIGGYVLWRRSRRGTL